MKFYCSEAVWWDEGDGGAEPGSVQSDEPQLHAHGILWLEQEGKLDPRTFYW
jgi:hypothetical protein